MALDLSNPDVQSELAARWYAVQFNVPIEQARIDIQQPQNASYKASAMGMAAAGQLSYLVEPQLGNTTPSTPPATQPAPTRAAPAPQLGTPALPQPSGPSR